MKFIVINDKHIDDKFITDLIIQILTMIAIAKEKGSRPVLYSPNVKVP